MFIPCIPWTTDAPVDHRPYGTLGLIALNVYLFFARTMPGWWATPVRALDEWAFTLGVLNPFLWATMNSFGGAWLRLLLDVLFLWTFGLVVEGKLGWRRFIPVYLLLSIAHGLALPKIAAELQRHVELPAFEVPAAGPVAMASFTMGSTALVYAIAAMALVWAPRNDVRCAAWIWVKGYAYEMPIAALVVVLVLADFVLAWFAGSTAMLAVSHAVAFGFGLFAATLWLISGKVNCQGWDLFSVMLGRTGDVDLEEMRQYHDRPDVQSGLDEDYYARRHHAGLEILRTHLAQRDATAALELHNRMASKLKDWQLPEAELAGLAQLLNERRSFPASIPLMFEYVRRFPDHSGPMRLELADILLHEENRPGKAVGVLERIPEGSLPAELFETRDELLREAQEKAVAGELELED